MPFLIPINARSCARGKLRLGLAASKTMGAYRAQFFTHSDEIFGLAHFAADDDEGAISYANEKLATGIGKGHQIWEGDRLVHTELYK
jgi:hypothetical protein